MNCINSLFWLLIKTGKWTNKIATIHVNHIKEDTQIVFDKGHVRCFETISFQWRRMYYFYVHSIYIWTRLLNGNERMKCKIIHLLRQEKNVCINIDLSIGLIHWTKNQISGICSFDAKWNEKIDVWSNERYSK